MSETEIPPPGDEDRPVTDAEDHLDPEAPADSPVVHPPREDADRSVDTAPDEDEIQEENAGTSLDQPSDSTS